MFPINRKNLFASVIIFFFFIALFALPAAAQERAGEIIQQFEKKEVVPRDLPDMPVIEQKEEKPQEAPAGPKILIKQINVKMHTKTGGEEKPLLLPPDAIRTITSRYENRELSFAEINQIANDITAAYRSRGYLLAYAFVPQQEVKDGVLDIGVIEAQLGKITVAGNTSYSTDFIRRHLEKIRKDPSIKTDTLQNSLLLLNEYPSLNVIAVMEAGKEFGTTDIVAQVQDSRPVSGSISYDNFGSKYTSENRLNADLNIGNLLGSGDLLTLRGITGLDEIDFDNLSYLRAEYAIPIMYYGTKMGAYYADSRYEVGEEYEPLEIHGKTHLAGLYLTHPLLKTRLHALDLKLGFDYKDIYEYMLDKLASKDKIRVASLGATYNFIDKFQGRNIINLTYHQGIRDLFGGTGKNERESKRQGLWEQLFGSSEIKVTRTPTSRLYADGGFSKGTLDIARIQKLPGYNYMILKGSGQISGDNLFVAEQFFIGGISTVRGFSSASQGGDQGYCVSAEFHLSPVFPEAKVFNQTFGDMFKFVLFADHGGVFKNDVLPGEDEDDYLTSIGAGLRLYMGKHFFARLDYAVPRIDGSFETGDAEIYGQVAFVF